MAASATEQSIVRKLSKLNGTGAGGSLSEDVDEEGSGGGSKGLVLKDHKMAAAATGSVSSSSSSSASSHAKPASKKSKKTSTRTVESSSQQASASTSTRHNNHHSFNSRLRNMLEIFRCRLNSTSSAAAARRRSSSQATSTAAAVNNNSSNNNNKQQRQSTVSSSNNPPLIAASTPTSGEGGGAHHFSSSDSCKKNNSSTCCQLCINECAETDAANDGTPYMYSISTCDHAFCVNCLRLYLKYQIVESRVSISCPQCSEKMHPNDIYTLLSVPVRHMNSSINSSVADSTTPPDTVTEVRAPTTILTRTKEEAAEQQRQWAQLVDKYEEFMLRRVLVAIPDIRFCPAPDCTYAVIASGCANCPQLNCQRDGCNTSFCYHCKQYWHPNLTCEDAAFQNAQSTLSAVGGLIAVGGGATSASGGGQFSKFNSSSNIIRSFLQRSNSHISITSLSGATTINGVSGAGGGASSAGGGARNQTTALIAGGSSGLDSLIKDEIKRCPKCAALIVKMDDGSCNHITCAVCGCEFCWLCMKEISDLHYLSPSGCTFWGKKPWSRKKKILWQLGTLIGAPVGIALVAGVAVPAIIIGLPIWAGRKVYVRYKSIGKHKRNLIVFGTVVGTVIVAPFVAALAVGIGVPILLAYVYGVVPISLCRGSGGCGVTTNNNGGVRFAFDDETDNVNFFQNSNASTGASTSKTPAKIEKATASTTAKASSNTATAVTVSSSSNTGGGNTQVTIPISAIETRPADSSIIMSTVSSSSNDTATASSSNLASTALLTGGAAAPTGSHKKSVSISTTATSATPVLVTITMAKKSNMMSAAIANRGAHSHSDRKHKRRRAKQSSNRPSSKTSSSNRKMLKNRLAACDASAQMTAMASVTIASVACGSVDPESANPDAAGGSGTSADIAGNVMTHLNNKLTSSLNIPPAVPRSSPPNDTMSSSSLSASSSHLLLHHHSKDAPNSPAATVDPVPLSTDQVQSASVNSASSLNKLCKISTDADTVSSVAAAVVKRSKQSDRKAANSSVAVQKARLNNNPSIGETSIGAYTTSMSASETNLGDIDLPLTSTGQQQRREAENDHDDDEEEDDESTSDDSDSESESEDSEDDSADETDDSDSDSESDQDGDGHVGGPTKYEADRDSASNRAIAGGSLCKESGAGLETCSVSLSLKTEDQKSAKLGETETAVTGKYNSSSNNQDTKSAITTSSYATGNFQPGGGGVVVDSVSMKSDTRSINPSVTALAGSIKDNQSVENLSSSNL